MMMRSACGVLLLGLILVMTVGCGGSGGKKSGSGASLSSQYKKLLKESNPNTRARGLVALSKKQEKAKDSDGATKSLGEALKSCEDIENAEQQAGAYTSVGLAYGERGEKGTTRKVMKKARTATDKIEDIDA